MRNAVLAPILLFAAAIVPLHAGPLIDAARNGDTVQVRALLEEGSDANEPGIMSPLQIASLNGHSETVELLIEGGADLDATNTIVGSALHAAVQRGRADIIELLIRSGADVNVQNKDGFTALMMASTIGEAASATALIAGGADVNIVGTGRSTATGGNGEVDALHLAAFNGHMDIYRALSAVGAAARPPAPEADFLDAADVARGQALAEQFCGNCHVVATGGADVLSVEWRGPSLLGVIGRGIGSVEGYDYSKALEDADGIWTADLLYSFAVNARFTMPGTRMVWNDGWSAEDVPHIVAYLSQTAE